MQYVPTPIGVFNGAGTLTKMGMNYIKIAIKKAASDIYKRWSSINVQKQSKMSKFVVNYSSDDTL